MNHRRLLVIPIALGVFAAATLTAQVITAPPLSGDFAFSTSGFELATPSGSSALNFDIKGDGLLTADGNGNLTGSETFTATNSAIPEVGTVSAPCGGTLAGAVAEPGDGTAQIKLQFTPSTPAPTGVGAQDACVPMAIALSCVEVLPNSFYPQIESAAGTTAAQPAAAKKHKKHKGPKGGTNGGPSGGGKCPPSGPGTGAPIAWPPYFVSSAERLKCVTTGITTSSTSVTIDGASQSLEMQQTAPASIIEPTPTPCDAQGLTDCGGGICTDLTSDLQNCGACGVVCDKSGSCQNGQCVSGGQCSSDVDCGSNSVCESGVCVPLKMN